MSDDRTSDFVNELIDEDSPLRSTTDSSRLLDEFGDRLCDHLHEVYDMRLSEVRIKVEMAFCDGRTTQLTAVRNNHHRWPLAQ